MSLAFPNLSWWLWSGKQKEPKLKNGSVNSSADLNLWELDVVKFPLTIGSNVGPKFRRVKRKLHTREERKVDREHDIVVVTSDGGCISDSESDGSDFSVGWSEPHAPGFQNDDENEGGFEVLVRCYGRGYRDLAENTNKVLDTIVGIPGARSIESKKYVEQWLSSQRNS